MSHTTVWRNRDRNLDLTPGLLHEEALGGAGRWADDLAVIDATTGAAVGYSELADRARGFAAGLRARGARRGDVLSLVASNGPDFPIAMHGALCAGLTLAPASPLLTARELGAFLRQVRARFVVADAGALPTVRQAAGAAGVETVFVLGSLPGDGPSAHEPVDPQAIALLMSSSGTTGLPKSAAHTHAGAVAMLRGFASFPLTRLGPDDIVGGVIPMAHIFGSVLLNSRCARGRGSSRCGASSSRRSWPWCRSTASPSSPQYRRWRGPWLAIRWWTATTSLRCGSCSSAPRRARPRSSASAAHAWAARWASPSG
jgi:AMP-binding enzyme